MISVTCPCCGGSIGELPEPERVKGHLSPSEQRVFDLLMTAGQEGIIRLDLSIAIHGEKKGITEQAIQATSSMVSKIRNKIRPYGYFIPKNHPAKRGIYRIQPEVAGA